MNPKQRAFENDLHLQTELSAIIDKAKVNVVVETGTEYGGSANAFCAMPPVKLVITMDIEQKFEPGELASSVLFYQGDSRKRLSDALPIATVYKEQPVLFFLDAHTSINWDVCPLSEELGIIAKFYAEHPDVTPPIIVIHDCLVPDKEFGFDTYADGPICYDNLKPAIEKVYPKGHIKRYNEVATGSARGCLFLQPL